jgi:hypothetical protein
MPDTRALVACQAGWTRRTRATWAQAKQAEQTKLERQPERTLDVVTCANFSHADKSTVIVSLLGG